jgi:gas vesicle structural protein
MSDGERGVRPRRGAGYLDRPAPSGLADVIEIILGRGLVIDAYAQVSLVGIEILTLDARVVVASVDTFLRFAEATNRLDLGTKGKDLAQTRQEIREGFYHGVGRGVVTGTKEFLFGGPR